MWRRHFLNDGDEIASLTWQFVVVAGLAVVVVLALAQQYRWLG
jgi:preprotein translocase subunit Sec61beta